MLEGIRQLTADWIASDRRPHCYDDNVKRARALLVSILTGIVYVAYAVVSAQVYGSAEIAGVSTVSSILAVCAIMACRYSTNAATAGHLYTFSLAFQVFGEMGFNGGLQAPAAPLTLLIVLAAIFSAGANTIKLWASVTVTGLVVISVMDIMLLLPPSELPRNTQIGDRVVSLVAGIVVSSLLIAQFERQARIAMKKLQEERTAFKHRALHDSLTDMPNRSHFYEHAQASIKADETPGNGRTIFYFDIDGFKQVNDQLGHAVGDELLQDFSARLLAAIGDAHFAARLAGDEFAMICETSDEDAMNKTRERLRSITTTPFVLNGKSVNIGLSVGHAYFPAEGDHLEALMNIADNRMYTDKAERREAAIKSNPDKIVNIPAKDSQSGATTPGTEPNIPPARSKIKHA